MHLSSLHRALERAGLSYKKGLIAAKRDRPALRQAGREWITLRQPRMRQEPHRPVFIDETAVKTNLSRLSGRAPVGERLYGTAPLGEWGTQTFIAGLTQNALIAPWQITGAMNGPAFDTYIETQLAPALDPGTVVILDNLSTHKSQRAAETINVSAPLIPQLMRPDFRCGCRRPIPRQQVIQPVDLVIVDTVENVGKIGHRIKAVELGRFDNGHRTGQGFRTGIGPCK